jgi:hypothetical protein
MLHHGKGMLIIWGSLSAEAKKSVNEGTLNDWWTNEHLPERLSIPGFLHARRYFTFEKESETSQYLVCYETASLDVLKSEAYLARLNDPTPGTAKFMPILATMNRCATHLLYTAVRPDFSSQSSVTGGAVAHLSLSPPSEPRSLDNLRTVIVEQLSTYLFANTVTLAIHLLEHDELVTRSGSSSKSYDGVDLQGKDEGDGAGRWIMLVELAEPAHPSFVNGPTLMKGCVGMLEEAGVRDVVWRIYGLICAVNA